MSAAASAQVSTNAGENAVTGGHAPIARQIATLALPIVLGNLLHTSHQIINTFWVGRLGADAVTAVSVAFPIIFLLVSLGSGLSIAGSILVAQHVGARNATLAAHLGAQTLVLVVGVSLLITVGGWLVQLPIAWLLALHTSLGVTGIWLAYPLAGAINITITLWYFRCGRWKTLRLIDARAEQHA